MAAKRNSSKKSFSFIGLFLKLCFFIVALPIFIIVKLYRAGVISKKTGWIAGILCSVLWLGIIAGANGRSEAPIENPVIIRTNQVIIPDAAASIVSEKTAAEAQTPIAFTPQPSPIQDSAFTPSPAAASIPAFAPTPVPTPLSAPTPKPVPTPTATPAPTVDPYTLYADLEEGSYGDNVRQLQLRLIQLGYLNDSADGSFGGNTKAAVEAYQIGNGFPVDGIASAAFQMALFSESAMPAQWVLAANNESVSSFIPISEPSAEIALTPTREVPQQSSVMVWIPTNGGTKYHSKSSCSGMIDPAYVTLEEAVALNFTPCGRCY